MKHSALIIPFAAFCGVVLSAHGAVVSDTWLDGTRTDPAAPVYSENGVDSDMDGNIESAWYGAGGTGASLEVVGGRLQGIVAPTSSSSWTTYFTPEGSGITLANPGDQLKITWVFTPTGVDTTNSSQSFRMAIVDTPGADRLTADLAPGSSTYAGYGMFMNMATTLNRSTPFSLMERSAPGTSSAFLSASGSWTSLIDDGNTGDIGYLDGVQYTYVFTATRTAAGELDLTASMTGGSIGNDGTLEVAFTDATPNTFTFDTFGVRPSRADQSASEFDTSLFQVELVPEPSSLALLGLGLAGLALRRNRR